MKPERITQEHLDAALRNDLATLSRRCFMELWPTTELKWAPHLDLICSRLTDVVEGRCRRLIINMPPRGLKSLLANVALPAMILGHDPTAQIISVSYSQELSEHFAGNCRTIMTSSFYQRIFPTRLKGARPALRELITSRAGYRLSTSLGGTLTGRGGNFLILDDPQKPMDLLSPALRLSGIDWFESVFSSRLNDKEAGATILVMQRIHEEDLAGYLLAKGGWELLSLPAIAEEDEEHHYRTYRGAQVYRRSEGGVLHPARESRARLDEARENMGSYNFAAQYQQRPVPRGGGLIRREWFISFDPAHPPEYDRVIQSWDCGNKAHADADFSVCVTMGIKGKQIFLISVYRAQVDFNDLKRAVVQQADLHNPSTILVEDAAAGTQLIQQMRHEGFYRIEGIVPKGHKYDRMYTHTGLMEAGRFFLPAEAHWREEYMHELTSFPRGKHDDQVDATSQALNFLASGNDAQMWIDHFAKLAEEARQGRS